MNFSSHSPPQGRNINRPFGDVGTLIFDVTVSTALITVTMSATA
jgi:hypothetical protein